MRYGKASRGVREGQRFNNSLLGLGGTKMTTVCAVLGMSPCLTREQLTVARAGNSFPSHGDRQHQGQTDVVSGVPWGQVGTACGGFASLCTSA